MLLCEDRLDFKCTVEESPGMPWPRAKFEARAHPSPCILVAALIILTLLRA